MLLDTKQIALKLNTKESWVRQEVFKKRIPYIKLNKRLVRFDEQAIDRWLKNLAKPQNLQENTKDRL
jgi:excisionase family DNA binding protein